MLSNDSDLDKIPDPPKYVEPDEDNTWDEVLVCPECGGDKGYVFADNWTTCDKCVGRGVIPNAKYVPPEDPSKHPKVINKTRTYGNRLYVAGEHLDNPQVNSDTGKAVHRTHSPIMFVSPAVLEEECGVQRGGYQSQSRTVNKMKVGVLKGSSGALFRNLLKMARIPGGMCYYTNLIKFDLKNNKLRKTPKKDDCNLAMPALRHEIKSVDPHVIVCLGKSVFDKLWTGPTFKQGALEGAYFWEPSLNTHMYLMPHITEPLFKPQFIGKWIQDLKEIRRLLFETMGVHQEKVPLNYRVLRTFDDVRTWVREMIDGGYAEYSVDAEWAGEVFVDGKLRSMQICWDPGRAAYVYFRDAEGNYTMDGTYAEVGRELNVLFDRPEVGFIGHQISADFLWMKHWLGIPVYRKARHDSLFAQQCLDEYSEYKLERLAIRYTDLGRYDLKLKLWLKENKQKDTDGFGRVPDDILIPYALRDVDVVMRATRFQRERLQQDQLEDYFYNIHLPFVTDVFTCFSYVGLPIDIDRLNYMRKLYTEARDKLNVQLQERIAREARQLLLKLLNDHAGPEGVVAFTEFEDRLKSDDDYAQAKINLKAKFADIAQTIDIYVEHYVNAPRFNIRSPDQMRRWIFDIKGYEPIKTTANEDGPSIPWSRVKTWTPAQQKHVKPACDKSTIKVLAEQDDILKDVLKLNLIGNQVKYALKPPKGDGSEDGMHKWVCSDGRIHCNFSSTETGRPRSWRPNMLNWSKEVDNEIEAALKVAYKDKSDEADKIEDELKTTIDAKIIDEFKELLDEDGLDVAKEFILPKINESNVDTTLFDLYAEYHLNLYSLRSCVRAPDGWCFVESDLQTAEIVTLAYISGDLELLSAITDPDVQFVLDKDTGKPHRICYAEYCRVAKEQQDSALLHDPNDARWKRDEHGHLVHPKRDLHWETIEDGMVMNTPREHLEKLKGGRGRAIYRGAGKVGNFQLQYGASGAGIEQGIEAATLTKPEKGIGDKIIESFSDRFKIAAKYQEDMALKALSGTTYRSFSGRLRRSFVLDRHSRYDIGMSDRDSERTASGLSREFRNFPQQEGVAAHMSRGSIWNLDYCIKHNMRARPVICLYDALLTLTPLEERFDVLKLHKRVLATENKWPIEDRILEFGTDDEFVMRWSTKPTPKQKLQLYDKNWNTTNNNH